MNLGRVPRRYAPARHSFIAVGFKPATADVSLFIYTKIILQ
jgi:hypothetical protein